MSQSEKIKILIYLNHPKYINWASVLYRNTNPMKYAKDVDVEYVAVKEKNIKANERTIGCADVVVFSRYYYDQCSFATELIDIAYKKHKTIVYDTDDLLHKVNLNFETGKHDESINVIRGVSQFIDYVLSKCDLITVPTMPLKKFYERKSGGVSVALLPNYYDPVMWQGLYAYKKKINLQRKKAKNKTVRIGWQGGNNHFLKDIKHIVGPLNGLKEKFQDKIKIVIFATDADHVERDERQKLFNFYFEQKPSVSVDQFPRALAELDLDIGLIVVDDNEFTQAKSNIKWIEYSLLGIPSICSRCKPYSETNAILVNNSEEEWIKAIENLILNGKKRVCLGAEARKMVKRFNVKKHAQKWVQTYRKAIMSKLH